MAECDESVILCINNEFMKVYGFCLATEFIYYWLCAQE
jgi:hypothetical protein